MRIQTLLFVAALFVSCNKDKKTTAPPNPPKNTTTATDPKETTNTPPDKETDIETKGTYEGQLSSSEIQPVFASKNTELRACYDAGKSKNKYLQGDVNIRFEISAEGKPAKIFAETSTLGEDEVERCFIGIIEKMSFPKPKGGAVLAAYPFSFQPSAQLAGVGEPTELDMPNYVSKAKDALKKCKSLSDEFQVSVWIDAEGKALSAGFSAKTIELQTSRTCAVEALKKAQYPKSKRKATHLIVASSDL